jgi:hypothetical protein
MAFNTLFKYILTVKSNLDTIILPRVDSLDDDAIWGGDFDIDMLSSIQDKTEINTAKTLRESYSIEAPEEQDALFQELSAQLSTQQNIGFVTARGKEIPKPSKKALAKAKTLFQDLPPIDDVAPVNDAVESSDDNDKQNQPMDKSTNHNDEFLAAIMGDDDDKFPVSITSQQVINDQQVNQEQQSYSVGFVTGCGKEIKPPSKEALVKAKTLLDNHSLAAAIPQSNGDQAMTNDIHENDDTYKQETLDHTDNDDAQLKLGTKRPANTPLSIKDHNSTTAGSEQRKKLKTNKDKDESSLDSTVPSTATSTPHLSFKEQQPHKPLQKNHHDKPLKDILKSTGSRTSRVRTGGGLFSQVKPFKSPIIPSLVDRTKAAVDSKRTATANEPVFDLSVPEHRYPLKELGPPGAYSRAQLTAMMVDPQVMDMTFKNATMYTPTPITQVRATLMEQGCKNVNIKWVTHHHAMIVWKLACLTRSYPDKMKHVLNQDEIIRQLLYR